MSISLPMILTAAGAFVVGLIGFAQILWSMQKVKVRGWGLTLGTSLVWAAILFGVAQLVIHFLPGHVGSLLTGYVVSFFILFVAQVKK